MRDEILHNLAPQDRNDTVRVAGECVPLDFCTSLDNRYEPFYGDGFCWGRARGKIPRIGMGCAVWLVGSISS